MLHFTIPENGYYQPKKQVFYKQKGHTDVELRKSCQQFKHKLTLFSSLQAEGHLTHKT